MLGASCVYFTSEGLRGLGLWLGDWGQMMWVSLAICPCGVIVTQGLSSEPQFLYLDQAVSTITYQKAQQGG